VESKKAANIKKAGARATIHFTKLVSVCEEDGPGTFPLREIPRGVSSLFLPALRENSPPKQSPDSKSPSRHEDKRPASPANIPNTAKPKFSYLPSFDTLARGIRQAAEGSK
jgi:hypothetical protein